MGDFRFFDEMDEVLDQIREKITHMDRIYRSDRVEDGICDCCGSDASVTVNFVQGEERVSTYCYNDNCDSHRGRQNLSSFV